MTYIKKILVGLMAVMVVMVAAGSMLVGQALTASAISVQTQEEADGAVFKVTRLDLSSGILDIGYYDMTHADNVITQFQIVYAMNGQVVTRAMMEETGLDEPDWGTVVVRRSLGDATLSSGSGVSYQAPAASMEPKLGNDYRASDGRLYYAVEVRNPMGENQIWVGGIDYTSCVVTTAKVCRPISTKWGIIRMTQDYEQWGGMYEVLPEAETEGIDYTGWKPKMINVDEEGSAATLEPDNNVENEINNVETGEAINSLAETMTDSEANVAAHLLTGAKTLTSDNWVDDGYYGTLDVPVLGGDAETKEKCYNCCMKNGFLIIVAFIIALALAQISKLIIEIVRHKGKFSAQEAVAWLVKDGGMPSGHTASFTAATVTTGLVAGFDSTVFALAVCVLLIVMHDASSVRYAVGKQGRALNTLLKRPLKVVEGHTIAEVMVGVILGTIVALVLNLILMA